MGLPPVEQVMEEDKYLYHTTAKSNKRSINRNGLDPSKKKPDGPYDTAYSPKADKFIRKIAEKTGHSIPFSRDECVFFFTLWDHIEEMYRGGQKEDSIVFVVDATKMLKNWETAGRSSPPNTASSTRRKRLSTTIRLSRTWIPGNG